MSAWAPLAIKLFHAVVFQVLWLAIVMTAGSHWSLVVAGVTLLIALLQLTLPPGSFIKGVAFVILTVCIGTVMEVLVTLGGIVDPVRCIVPFPFSPIWLVGLWIAFAVFMKTTLTHLHGKPAIQWCVGAVGGPLAYWSSARLGAVELHGNIVLALGVLALLWGGVCVLCFAALRRIEASKPMAGVA